MSHKQALALIVSVTLLGFALRVYRIDAVSFRGDEAFTVLNWVSHPLLDTLRGEIPLADPQPPLAFALFRVWSLLLGTSEFSMRILPALLSLIGIPAMYALGSRLVNRRLGTLAALLWALHPFLIWHAQDSKAYAIWAACSTAALWLALRALRKQRPIDWLLYVTAACIAAYLYYLELFALLALNLYVLSQYWRKHHTLRPWLLSQLAITFILAPWFVQERLLFGSGYSGTTFPFEPAQIFTWLLPASNFGMTVLPTVEATIWPLWPLLMLVLVLGLIARWQVNRSVGLLLALCGFLPVLLLSLVSFRMNVFAPRYVLSVAPIYTLLAASFLLAAGRIFRHAVLRRALPVLLAGGWLCISGISLINYYFVAEFAKAPDWRGLVSYLQTHGSPTDFVVQAAADEAFTLYFGDFSASERLPANPRQPVDEIMNALQYGLSSHQSVWLVAHAPDDWPNKDVPLSWLAANAQEVRSAQIGGLPVRQFLTWQVRADEIAPQALATFHNTVDLVGIQTSVEPSDELLVWLYWQPLQTTDRPLKAFVHLTGAINPATGTPLWAQEDHYPQYERISTTTWSSGEVYRDVFRLPFNGIPEGEYDLLAGWYDPETGQRLPVEETDSYRIGSIALRP